MNNTFDEIWEVLMKAEKILIPLHVGPDPDSMGSAIASARVLTSFGKTVQVVSADVSPNLEALTKLFPIQHKDPADIDLEQFDTFLAQDIASLNRFSRKEGFQLPSHIRTINIDHHKTNSYFCQLNFVDATFNATAEILFEFYTYKNVTIDPELALALFFGVVSDTGWFAYGPPPRTYEIAQKLVEAGVDSRLVSADLNRTTIEELKIKGLVLSRLEIDRECNFAFSYVTREDLDALSLADEPLRTGKEVFKYLPSIDFGILITEEEAGMYKASLRTREAHSYDVAQLAMSMNGPEYGGGHTMAAGFQMRANSVEEVLERVREVVKSL